MVDQLQNSEKNYIAALDGVRGLMAFWVYYGHLKAACIAGLPFIGAPGVAVDVFMLLSGFLMTYHWQLRASEDNLSFLIKCKKFYIRRFFRIAPLYYLLFIIALMGNEYFKFAETQVHLFVSPLQSSKIDNLILNYDSIRNVLLHFSFLFGLFPAYVSNNILPDWSISLEMQFYMLFPIIILITKRFGVFYIGFFCLAISIITYSLLGLYNNAGFLGHFIFPGFLPFKINIFFIGILLGKAYLCSDNFIRRFWFLFFAAGLMSIKTAIQFKFFFFFISFMLFYDFKTNVLNISKYSRHLVFLFESRISKFIGNTSYALYLIHRMILFPVLLFLYNQEWYRPMIAEYRLAIAFVAITPIVYSSSYILYKYIEKKGIFLGKKLIENREYH